MPEPVKKCCRCKEVKPHTDFYNNSRNSDGKQSACKSCTSAAAIQWQIDNPERYGVLEKRYRDKNKEKLAAYQHGYYLNVTKPKRRRERDEEAV